MRPIQPPPQPTGGSTNPPSRNRPRRRPDLSLPLPQRDSSSLPLPVPLPLPAPPPPNSNTSGSSPVQPTRSPPQTQRINFSDLEKLNRIGSGSGGTVYKVVHKPTQILYALKVIHGNHDETVRLQICREIGILRDVNFPNVVQCHDMFDHAGEIQVLLEFMDGGSLEGKRIPDEAKLASLAQQVLNGLAYLHKKKIVHRDIKPQNLLINNRRIVKIADFGVSKILEQTIDACNSSVGTIAYMSPERINTDLNKGRYDGYAGDIWSLGVSVLEFYLGRFPFVGVARGGDWASLMCAICMAPPPEAPATASREFRDFIRYCLQREPERRWTAQQLLNHPFITQNNTVNNHNSSSSSSSCNNHLNGHISSSSSSHFQPPPPHHHPHPVSHQRQLMPPPPLFANQMPPPLRSSNANASSSPSGS